MSHDTLERTRGPFRQLTAEADLLDTNLSVWAKPLTPEEAIGTPGRRDFPILKGEERMVEAIVGGGRGQAFTDTAREFTGRLSAVIDLPLDDNGNRAIYLASLNATLRHLGRIADTLHCQDDDPEFCGARMAKILDQRLEPGAVVGLIGLNPALAEHLATHLGSHRLIITDLDPRNLADPHFGVEIWDGATRTAELIRTSDFVLVSGSTLVNGTYDTIRDLLEAEGKSALVFGVTAAGPSHLLGFDRLCPYAR